MSELGFQPRLYDFRVDDNLVHGCLECLKAAAAPSGEIEGGYQDILREVPFLPFLSANRSPGTLILSSRSSFRPLSVPSVRSSLQRQSKLGNLAQKKALEK